jgi:hypothetical protein
MAIALQLDPELAQLDDRRSAPADGVRRIRQRERHSVRLPKWLAVAEDAIVAWRRLDRESHGSEPADELADVLPHLVCGHWLRRHSPLSVVRISSL